MSQKLYSWQFSFRQLGYGIWRLYYVSFFCKRSYTCTTCNVGLIDDYFSSYHFSQSFLRKLRHYIISNSNIMKTIDLLKCFSYKSLVNGCYLLTYTNLQGKEYTCVTSDSDIIINLFFADEVPTFAYLNRVRRYIVNLSRRNTFREFIENNYCKPEK